MADSPKTFSFVLFNNPDNITSPGERGHKFNAFKMAPETWVFEGLPDLNTWIQTLNMCLSLAPNGGRSGLGINVGFARLHFKDTFSRKEGALQAKNKMKLEFFNVTDFYVYSPYEKDLLFRVGLESNETIMAVNIYKNGRPQVIYASRKDANNDY